jgi:PleD family two-component response regulator
VAPRHSDEPEQILRLRLAREALAQAKASGKQRWVIHEPNIAGPTAAAGSDQDH